MQGLPVLFKVIKKIVKAAETAQQNRERCQDLADRVHSIGVILREDGGSAAGAGRGGAYPAGAYTVLVTTHPLERLQGALDGALELVESCRRRESGFAWGIAVITSESTATKFDDVNKRITDCLADLGFAEQKAARRRDYRHHAIAEAALAQESPPPPPSPTSGGA